MYLWRRMWSQRQPPEAWFNKKRTGPRRSVFSDFSDFGGRTRWTRTCYPQSRADRLKYFLSGTGIQQYDCSSTNISSVKKSIIISRGIMINDEEQERPFLNPDDGEESWIFETSWRKKTDTDSSAHLPVLEKDSHQSRKNNNNQQIFCPPKLNNCT